jgi:DNA repair exonuclease SbcCD ATPase subunit
MPKILNPETKRMIDMNGAPYKKLLKKYNYDESTNSLILKMETKSTVNINIVKKSDEQYDFLVHISDVHILLKLYNSGRETEFKQVFKNTYEKLKEFKKQHDKMAIVLTGDILDTKINMEPEMYGLAVDFFTELSNIAKIILISGNHDINEYNLSRACTLGSILYQRNLNVDYLEYSGMYEYGNITFVVSSLKDQIFIRYDDLDKTKIENKTVIALYHGLINGAKINNNYTAMCNENTHSSRYRSLKDFEGYDMVLLGDVHRYQSLNAKGNIAYAGSLLQLKSDECEDHGVLLWDVKHKTYTFHKIANDYGFVHIKIKDGEIVDNLEKIPKNPTFICILENTTQSQFKIIRDVLTNKYNAKNIKYMRNRDDMCRLVIPEEDQSTITLKTELLQIEKTIEDKILCKKLQDLHEKIYTMMDIEEKTNYDTWDVISVEFMNVFIFGNSKINKLIFNGGISNILAENFAGKSTLVSIIIFGLFDRTGFDKCKADVLHKMEDKGYIKLIFRHNNNRYLIEKDIERMTRTERNQKNETYSTYFYKLTDANEKINITGTKKTETCSMITDYVGTFENFITNSTLLPRLRRTITNMTPAERLKAILKLLRYERCTKYTEQSKELLKDLEMGKSKLTGELDMYLNKYNANHYEELEKKIISMEQEKDNIIQKLETYKEKINKDESKKIEAECKKSEIDGKIKNIVSMKYHIIPTIPKQEAINKIKEIGDIDNKPLISIDVQKHKIDEIKKEINKIEQYDYNYIKSKLDELNENKPKDNLISDRELRDEICENKYKLSMIANNICFRDELKIIRDNISTLNIRMNNMKDKLVDETECLPIECEENIEEQICSLKNITQQLDSTKIINELEQLKPYRKKLLITRELRDEVTSLLKGTNTENIEKQINYLQNKLIYIKINEIKNELDKSEEDYKILKNELQKKEETIAMDKIKNLEILLESFEKKQNWYKEHDKYIAQKIECEEKNKLEENLSILEKELTILLANEEKEKMLNILHKWELYDEYKENIVLCKNINDELDKIKKENSINLLQYEKYNKTLYETEYNIKFHLHEKGKIENIIKEMEEVKNKLKEKEQDIEVYKKYNKIFCKKGIPMRLIKDQLEKIEKMTNELFSKYTKYKVKILVDEETVSLLIEEKEGGYDLHVERISSSEDIMLNIAIKMSCNRISPWGRSSIFIIDETLDCIDKVRWEDTIRELMELLKEEYINILLISQRELPENSIDTKIEIIKHKTYSELK